MPEDAIPLKVGVTRETFAGERRVSVTPGAAGTLKKAGIDVLVEPGAGVRAGFPDEAYVQHGAELAAGRPDVFSRATVILQVRAVGANPEEGRADVELLGEGQCLIASCEPLAEPEPFREVAARKATSFALELLPRITRAQSMDVLSSMATIAGYKAVLLAADTLPRMFPMLMTAAGTVTPARVFVVGAGVAGLQAIATARRLGAVVRAYDVRPVVKEQVESLGGKFVELELETGESETAGGYAKQMDEEFYRRQREMMARVVAESDVVITTAAVPGRKSPVLVTAEMIRGMPPGSVIVDLAAERGGNCEPTKADETVITDGVTILGPVNLPATIPYHASEMYSRNITTFLLNLVKEGRLEFNTDDEIVRETMITHRGEIVNPRIRELLGLEPLPAHAARPEAAPKPAAAPEADRTEESAVEDSTDDVSPKPEGQPRESEQQESE